MTNRVTRLAAWLLIGGVAAALPACGSSPQALCDMKCECEGCGPAAYDNCLADAEGDAREADFRNCGGFYDDYLACQDATGFCDGFEWETSCKPERERFKSCVDGK